MYHKITDTIAHAGIVESIGDGKCVVRILQSSACSGCAAHQLCSSSESKEKLVEAEFEGMELRVGEHVVVEGTVRQGLRAVYIGYLVPLVLMVCALAIGVMLWDEGTGAVLSILALATYYAVLYIFRGRVGKSFAFRVVKR